MTSPLLECSSEPTSTPPVTHSAPCRFQDRPEVSKFLAEKNILPCPDAMEADHVRRKSMPILDAAQMSHQAGNIPVRQRGVTMVPPRRPVDDVLFGTSRTCMTADVHVHSYPGACRSRESLVRHDENVRPSFRSGTWTQSSTRECSVQPGTVEEISPPSSERRWSTAAEMGDREARRRKRSSVTEWTKSARGKMHRVLFWRKDSKESPERKIEASTSPVLNQRLCFRQGSNPSVTTAAIDGNEVDDAMPWPPLRRSPARRYAPVDAVRSSESTERMLASENRSSIDNDFYTAHSVFGADDDESLSPTEEDPLGPTQTRNAESELQLRRIDARVETAPQSDEIFPMDEVTGSPDSRFISGFYVAFERRNRRGEFDSAKRDIRFRRCEGTQTSHEKQVEASCKLRRESEAAQTKRDEKFRQMQERSAKRSGRFRRRTFLRRRGAQAVEEDDGADAESASDDIVSDSHSVRSSSIL